MDSKLDLNIGKTLFRDYFGLKDLISDIQIPGRKGNRLFSLYFIRCYAIINEEFEDCKKYTEQIKKLKKSRFFRS